MNDLGDAIHDNSSFLEPSYRSLLGKMDISYESLSGVMKMLTKKNLDPAEPTSKLIGKD